MSESFSEELKKELVKQAVKSLEDPFKMLTVKDVAKDLYMGENKTNEIFNREDFPSVNIGKIRIMPKGTGNFGTIKFLDIVFTNDIIILYKKINYNERGIFLDGRKENN